MQACTRGKCPRPVVAGAKMCAYHLEKARGYNARKDAKHKAQGLCTRCSEPALPGFTTCAKHRKSETEKSNARNAALKEAGRCRCGAPVVPGKSRCEECLAKQRVPGYEQREAEKEQRRAEKEREDAEKMQRKAERERTSRLRNSPLGCSLSQRLKEARKRAHRVGAPVEEVWVSDLIDRFEEVFEYRCCYCGVPVEFTDDPVDARLELEHIIPVDAGGAHALGNLAPACRRCNGAKGAILTAPEWAVHLAARDAEVSKGTAARWLAQFARRALGLPPDMDTLDVMDLMDSFYTP